MGLKLTPDMSTDSEKKISELEREEVDHFSFPVLCFLMMLKPKSIYRIMTISDLVFSTYSLIFCLILVIAFSVHSCYEDLVDNIIIHILYAFVFAAGVYICRYDLHVLAQEK